jgi:hypothetical protein
MAQLGPAAATGRRRRPCGAPLGAAPFRLVTGRRRVAIAVVRALAAISAAECFAACVAEVLRHEGVRLHDRRPSQPHVHPARGLPGARQDSDRRAGRGRGGFDFRAAYNAAAGRMTTATLKNQQAAAEYA